MDIVNDLLPKGYKTYSSFKRAKRWNPYLLSESEFEALEETLRQDFIGIVVPNKYITDREFYVGENASGVPLLLSDLSSDYGDELTLLQCRSDGLSSIERVVTQDDSSELALERASTLIQPPVSPEMDNLLSLMSDPTKRDQVVRLCSAKEYTVERLKLGTSWYKLPEEDKARFPLTAIQSSITGISDLSKAMETKDSALFTHSYEVNKRQVAPLVTKQKIRGGSTMQNMKAKIIETLAATGARPGEVEYNNTLNSLLEDPTSNLSLVGASAGEEALFVAAIKELMTEGGSSKGAGTNKMNVVIDNEDLANEIANTIANITAAASTSVGADTKLMYEIFRKNAQLHLFATGKGMGFGLSVSRKNQRSESGDLMPLDANLYAEYKAQIDANPKLKGKAIELSDGKQHKLNDLIAKVATCKFVRTKPTDIFGMLTTIPRDLLTVQSTDSAAIKALAAAEKVDTITKMLPRTQFATVLLQFGGEINEDPRMDIDWFTTKGKNLEKVQTPSVFRLKFNKVNPPVISDMSVEEKVKFQKNPQLMAPALTNTKRGTAVVTHANFIPVKQYEQVAVSSITTPDDIALYNNAYFGGLVGLNSKTKNKASVTALDILAKDQAGQFTFDAVAKQMSSAFIKTGAGQKIMAENPTVFSATGTKVVEEVTQIPVRALTKNGAPVFKYIELKSPENKTGFGLESVLITVNGERKAVTKVFPELTEAQIWETLETEKAARKQAKATSKSTLAGESASAVLAGLGSDATKFISGIAEANATFAAILK